MVLKFAERFTLIANEQMAVVIDDRDGALLRTTKVFLVRRVLTSKVFNKDRFKRLMLNLWRPKPRVTIVELKGGLFSFRFNNHRERALIQEFWIQVKRLHHAYVTRHMG